MVLRDGTRGWKIARFREQLGMTVAEFASATGAAETTVISWEEGVLPPGRNLAGVFNSLAERKGISVPKLW